MNIAALTTPAATTKGNDIINSLITYQVIYQSEPMSHQPGTVPLWPVPSTEW